MEFSISCTSRAPRGTEQNGVEYFFLTPYEFRQRIEKDEFLEYEEVYKDRFYGTLKSQVEKQLDAGENVVFDVDVKGGCNIKKYYGDRALSVFIQPPSIDELRKRLVGRGTDAPEVIEHRVAKAGCGSRRRKSVVLGRIASVLFLLVQFHFLRYQGHSLLRVEYARLGPRVGHHR